MASVLITHSYFLSRDPKEERAMMPYMPLGSLYAAAVLRREGHDVSVWDSMLARGPEEIGSALASKRPHYVVVYDDDFNYLSKMCLGRMREAAFTIFSLSRAAGATVIVHGSDATDHVQEFLTQGAHYLLIGEAENTLTELLLALESAGDPSAIPGLAFSSDAGVVRTAPRAGLRQLDALPFPARDLVDVEKYRGAWRAKHGYFSMNMVTTRGCPYHCNWCAKPLYGQSYATRSPANVADEMALVKRTYHPDHIWFCDDIFGLKPGWIKEFVAELRLRDAIIPYKCLARADLLLRDGCVDDLRASGCETVWLGAESGSQSVLDAMEKGITVEQIHEAARQLRAAGIRVGFFLQYGYPGETRADIDSTLAMVQRCRPDEIGISVSYPLPGTPFYERVKNELGAKTHWDESADLAVMFRGTFCPEFYRTLHRVTHKQLRLWQALDTAAKTLRSPRGFRVRDARTLAAGVYHGAGLPFTVRRLNALARSTA